MVLTPAAACVIAQVSGRQEQAVSAASRGGRCWRVWQRCLFCTRTFLAAFSPVKAPYSLPQPGEFHILCRRQVGKFSNHSITMWIWVKQKRLTCLPFQFYFLLFIRSSFCTFAWYYYIICAHWFSVILYNIGLVSFGLQIPKYFEFLLLSF